MFVTHLDGDVRPVSNPSHADIERAIRGLDGIEKTLITLETESSAHLCIGGGEDGHYVCYATFDNNTFFSLVDLQKGDGTLSLVVGGQEGDYSIQTIVSLTDVLIAAHDFAESGELATNLKWKPQGGEATT